MSEKHLRTGSEKPPIVAGKLRLYGMLFCPYVLRVRLVLLKKRIPHDIVYVDLQNKPEWLLDMNPKGQVPILDVGSKIICESLEICYYLEENYREPRLCPENVDLLEKDKELIIKVDDAIKVFYQSLMLMGKKKLTDILKEVEPTFAYFEEELAKRGNFFNGAKAGFVDYMAWPWVEKLPVFNMIFNENVAFPEKYKNLRDWRERMLGLEPVKETIMDIQRHYEYVVFVRHRKIKDVDEV